MTGHSILYLGRGEFATAYLSELETLPFCALLTRSAKLELPADVPSVLDLVLIEAGSAAGGSLPDLIHSLDDYPVVALTTLADEDDVQRGRDAGVNEYQVKLDREALLEAVERLLAAVAPAP